MYHLNAEGSWEDQGTGYASIHDKCIYCNAEEANSKPYLPGLYRQGEYLTSFFVQGEHPILEAPISMEEIYQRQGGALFQDIR